ncbi:MAG TPA: 3'(2'),5'-bisphosphate nucleotidase [Candidatus Hydrogenedentes bacterium]|nr:3'(2'),5'-bisphosphate nucleotidase [Candidatus Hydrogenedentota bacterium]
MLELTQAEISFVVNTLRETAQLARRIQSGMALMNLTKSDFSPVTVADFALQAVTAHRLSEAFPGAALVAEERAARLREPENAKMLEVVTDFVGRVIPGATADQVCAWIDLGADEPGGAFWTLDPIDGTKGYRRGGQYAVALAYVDQGQVTLGGLACPNLGEDGTPELMGLGALAVAQRGKGSWLGTLDCPEDPFVPMRVSDCADPAAARLLRSVESAHTNAEAIESLAAVLGITEDNVTLMDSQAKYLTLAAGKAELLFRLLSPAQLEYRECIWDQAAGSIILEEAGGRVTDLKGKPLNFATGRKLTDNIGVVASNGHLHDVALQALARMTG